MRSFSVFLLASLFLQLNSALAQNQSPQTKGSAMSDREKAGLHGVVKSCTVETTRFFSESPTVYVETSEYSPDGRLLSKDSQSPYGPEWLQVNSYDSQGRLAETVSGPETTPAAERSRTLYSYGEHGRLTAITNPAEPGAASLRYDDQGRRIESQRFPEIPDEPDTAVGSPMWEDSELPIPVPSGGTLERVFNDRGQPVEARALDKNGQLVARIVRQFDQEGKPLSDRLISENPAGALSVELNDKLNAAQQKAVAAFITSQMSGTTSYKYDSHGRLIERRRSLGMAGDEITTVAYNDHNDKILERTASAESPDFGTEYGLEESGKMIPQKKSPAPPPSLSEVHYEYVYDSAGNWTEQKVSRGTPNGTFGVTETVKRTLTYY